MVFIAHDLSVVRHLSSTIAIMYLGRIVERGGRDAVFDRFLHPYTEALISAIPRLSPGTKARRIILSGDLPSPLAPPSGCPFHPRCIHAGNPLFPGNTSAGGEGAGTLGCMPFQRENFSIKQLYIDFCKNESYI